MIALALLLAQAATPSPVPAAPGTAKAANAAVSASAANAGAAASAGDSTAQDAYEKRCVFCHALDGSGSTKKGKKLKAPDFRSAKWQTHTSDDEIMDAIENGIPKKKMPAFKKKLSQAEIDALIPYLRGLARK